MAFIPIVGIARTTFIFLGPQNQRMTTHMDWISNGPPAPYSTQDMSDLANAADGGWAAGWLSEQVTAMTFQGVEARDLTVEFGAIYTTVNGSTGGSGDNPIPMSNSLLVMMGDGSAGRTNLNRMYIPGLNRGLLTVTGAVWDPSEFAGFESNMAAIRNAVIGIGSGPLDWTQQITSRKGGIGSAVTWSSDKFMSRVAQIARRDV